MRTTRPTHSDIRPAPALRPRRIGRPASVVDSVVDAMHGMGRHNVRHDETAIGCLDGRRPVTENSRSSGYASPVEWLLRMNQ